MSKFVANWQPSAASDRGEHPKMHVTLNNGQVSVGPVWRSLALTIGCTAQRYCGNEVQQPKPKYKGMCGGCGRAIYRHRRLALICSYGTLRIDPRFAFVWSQDCE
jgi:hypothetical protein